MGPRQMTGVSSSPNPMDITSATPLGDKLFVVWRHRWLHRLPPLDGDTRPIDIDIKDYFRAFCLRAGASAATVITNAPTLRHEILHLLGDTFGFGWLWKGFAVFPLYGQTGSDAGFVAVHSEQRHRRATSKLTATP